MRQRLLFICMIGLLAAGIPLVSLEITDAAAQGFRGLSISTPFPAQTVRTGETVTLPVTIRNHGLPPQSVALIVAEAAPGWRARFLGGGRPVRAVHVSPDQEASISLRLEPPARARPGTYRFRIVAEGATARSALALALTLGEVAPPRLTLTAELPVLRGPSTSSFRYRLTLQNESDRDLLVTLDAQTPKGFQVSFTPSLASQQVTSLPIKAGESKDIDVEVTLPKDLPAGRYNMTVRASGGDARAQLRLGLEVTGRPELSLTGPDGRLSGRAYAGRETPTKLIVKNEGTAPAQNVELSATEPSGWEVKWAPERVDALPPGQQREVTANIKPSDKAIAGDYIVTLRASAGDASASADFRVTVLTSTFWGLVGILLVAVALGVVSLAVSRYGRR